MRHAYQILWENSRSNSIRKIKKALRQKERTWDSLKTQAFVQPQHLKALKSHHSPKLNCKRKIMKNISVIDFKATFAEEHSWEWSLIQLRQPIFPQQVHHNPVKLGHLLPKHGDWLASSLWAALRVHPVRTRSEFDDLLAYAIIAEAPCSPQIVNNPCQASATSLILSTAKNNAWGHISFRLTLIYHPTTAV